MRPPRVLLPALALILASFLAYFPVLRNQFVWDDDYYIQGNVQLLTPAGLGRIWMQIGSEPQYYPLTHTTFWIEYQFFGGSPLPYHVDNLILHTLGAIVLWRLLRRLRVPGAWGAALLFCVHPLQVESVAWATERKNVLSGLLYFLSASAYLGTKWGRGDDSGITGWGWYAASLILFLAAILAKSVTTTLPAAILLMIWWQRGRLAWRDLWPVLPMIVAGAAMGSLTSWMEKHVVGAVGPDFEFTILQRLVIAGRAVWFYLGKLIWPVNLSFVYPRWDVDPIAHPTQLLFPLAALAGLVFLWSRRTEWGRGPIVAALFFVGTLSPALGFANVFPMRYSFVADHFQYLACIGPIALFCAGVTRLSPKLELGVVLALAIVCCGVSEARCRVFYDRTTLWTDTLQKNPTSWMVRANYGETLADAGDWAGAEREFRQALLLRQNDGLLETRIGVARAAQGDNPGAIAWLKQAIQDLPESQESIINRLRSEPYYRLGTVYGSMPGDENLAEDAYREALKIQPDYEIAQDNLAGIMQQEGETDAAIDEYRAALRVNPESVPAHTGLGNAYLAQGNFEQAAAEYESVLQIRPDDVKAINNLGDIYARQQKWARAIDEFELALRIDPNFDLARRNLAEALQKESVEPQTRNDGR
jgi:tetratricopeptide (TPR) repeat protein